MHNMNLTRQTMAAALLAACCSTTFAAGQSATPAAEAVQGAGQVAGQISGHGPRGGPDGRAPEMPSFRAEGGPEHGSGPGIDGRGPGGSGHGSGREFGPGIGHGMGRGFGHGFRHGIGHLRGGLRLTEAQQDKLFAIEHGAAPQRRQQQKALRHAHEALRALRDADRFDEARAGGVSRELGQAIAAEALLEARLHAQVLAVLTPEQREQLRKRRPQPPQERP
jgi:Spy/CpxP family protein refolding chaperone